MCADAESDRRFMQMAMDACRRGIEKGQSPFGACIARGKEVLAATHNQVWLNTDATAHAEVMAIREACAKLNDIHLSGATIYSTTEPCPMCFGAIHWARIGRIVFAARVEDAQTFGFNELPISNSQFKQLTAVDIEIVSDFHRDDAHELYHMWQQQNGTVY